MSFDPRWNEIHSQMDWKLHTDMYFMSFLGFNYKAIAGSTFLDLGCANGSMTLHLARNGFKVIGIDASEVALTKLKKSLTPDMNVTLILGDMNELELEDHSIGVALDVCTLQGLPFDESKSIVQKARKWLRPSGVFISYMATDPFELERARGMYMRLTSEDELKSIFEGYVITYKKIYEELGQTLWYIQGTV